MSIEKLKSMINESDNIVFWWCRCVHKKVEYLILGQKLDYANSSKETWS